METPNPRPESRSWTWASTLALGCLFAVLLAILLPRARPLPTATAPTNTPKQTVLSHGTDSVHSHHSPGFSGPSQTPEEIVAGKVARFTQDRLRILHSMAKRYKLPVAPDVEKFFQAAAAGNWDELNAAFKVLRQRRESGNGEDLGVLWGPILETLLVAECAHNWPAQKLLDYGQATLGSLRPDMVYVGGTDPGRGIPTLLNETSEGDRHIVLTQNGLADGSYLQYIDFLYGDRVKSLTQDDSQHAFQDYLADAQKRLAHDQQFPDEPKQLRPGENVTVDANGHIQVSGQVAVMLINENLLRTFMANNPDLSFALEESFPLKSTYPNAVPLGPLMELGVKDTQTSFTPQVAAQAVDYWRDTAQQMMSDPETPADSDARLTYSKMAAAQAALLASHQYPAEAEQAFRSAIQLSPASPEAVYGLGNLLAGTGRNDEASQLITQFQRAYPTKNPPPAWTLTFGAPTGGQAAHQ